MKKTLLLAALCGLLSCCGVLAAPKFAYTLSMPEPHTHYFEVQLTVTGLRQPFLDFKLPAWTPGSYLIREYAKNVEGFRATGGKAGLRTEKTAKNTWRVYTGNADEVTVAYRVYAFELSVRTPFLDASHAYVQPAAVFMYVDKHLDQPLTLTVKPYKDWTQLSTGMAPAGKDKWTLAAPSYDILADSPLEIGNQKLFQFTALGIPHTVAMYGTGNYNEKQLAEDMRRIVEETGKVVGENPNKDYTFIVHNIPGGGGGLEHLNSTVLQTGRWGYENNYAGFLSLVAHEYFHLWNVKRIRPKALGPFDYENENYTNLLWVAEGVTSYYDDLITHRAGFTTADQYLTSLAGSIGNTENAPGNRVQSLAECSWDAWIKYYRPNENSNNTTVSYYTKGSIIAALLDLEIMHGSGGQKTFDDVLRLLYAEYYKKQKRGFTDAEMQQAVETVAGKSLDAFFKDYIYGTKKPDYDTYFGYVGLQLAEYEQNQQAAYLGAATAVQSGRLTVTGVQRGTPAYQHGLNVNDEIMAVDGYRTATPDELQQAVARRKPGEKAVFTISRAGMIQTLDIPLAPNPNISYRLERLPAPTAQQQALLRKWLRL